MASSLRANLTPTNPCDPSSRKPPIFPKRPVRPVFPERPVQAAPEKPAFQQERLELLLNTIKQDLNQLARK